MKKQMTVAALCLALCLPCAKAETPSPDYSSMTKDELHAVIDQARQALMAHEVYLDSDKVILDEQGILVTMRADYMVEYDAFTTTLIVENNSDKKITLLPENVYVNGWQVYAMGVSDLEPGKKAEGKFFIGTISRANVDDAEDLEDLEFEFNVFDCDAFETVFTSEKIHIAF